MNAEQAPLFLFGKAPVAGSVKTRMQTHLPAQDCAELAEQMLRQSIEVAMEAWPGSVSLAATPDASDPFFKALRDEYGIQVIEQAGEDLGQRMANVLHQGIESAGRAAVMGCDVPHISVEALRSSYDSLVHGRNVVGPATDGGFYFLGLVTLEETLFDGIPWGGDQVLAGLEENARCLEIEFEILESLRDIDRWEDLVWLASRDADYRKFMA